MAFMKRFIRANQSTNLGVCSIFLCTFLFFNTSSHASTPDGATPSVENFCDNPIFAGKAKGLCNAYCEATDCGDFDPVNASPMACDNLRRMFISATGLVDDMGEPAICNTALETCDAAGLASCLTPSKIVFVTSADYTGNLLTECENLGLNCLALSGLESGDAICNYHASNASLSGTYKAWLSSGIDSPDTRFNKFNGSYVLTTGEEVAANYIDLTDGTLSHAINSDELGVAGVQATVWTGTGTNGLASGPNCNAWTAPLPQGIEGGFGRSPFTDLQWTELSADDCSIPSRLYCFEQ